MRAVMADIPPAILAWRKRTGADRWDEMWEGVLHMPPAPNREHQDLEGNLEFYLRMHWARSHHARVYHQINVAAPGGWPNNYRIPDLVLLTPERFGIDRNEYFEGAPDVVVEIHSPGDESYDKLGFYAELGVPEVWIISRDSKAPELYRLQSDGYERQGVGENGWLLSSATGIELRAGQSGKPDIRLAGDETTQAELPQD
jgi:Uma2 family endonuclease